MKTLRQHLFILLLLMAISCEESSLTEVTTGLSEGNLNINMSFSLQSDALPTALPGYLKSMEALTPMINVTPESYTWQVKNIYFLGCYEDGSPMSCSSSFTMSATDAGDSVSDLTGSGKEYFRYTALNSTGAVEITLNDTSYYTHAFSGKDSADIPYIGGIQIEMMAEIMEVNAQIGDATAQTITIGQAMVDEDLSGLNMFSSIFGLSDVAIGDRVVDLDQDGMFGFLDSTNLETATRPSGYTFNDPTLDPNAPIVSDPSEPEVPLRRGIDKEFEWFTGYNMSYLIPMNGEGGDTYLDTSTGEKFNAYVYVDIENTFGFGDPSGDNDKNFDIDDEDERGDVFFALPCTVLAVCDATTDTTCVATMDDVDHHCGEEPM